LLLDFDLQEKWEDLHQNPRYQPKYPHETVVRWAFTKLNPGTGQKVLDVGCGTGRHAFMMASEGFEITATDISRSGISFTQNLAQKKGLTVDTRVAEIDKLDFNSESFDGILVFGVLYYVSFEKITKSINIMHRLLKPGGQILIITRSDQDWRANYGDWVAPSTYNLNKLQGTPAEAEQGMVQVFLTKFEVQELMQDFNDVQIDSIALTREGGKYTEHDWIITATK
jgi:ubiquinone/menaquinone biosynthesis C-methylase UbiE